MTSPMLEVRGLTKRFGAVVANSGIGFELAAGEVLGVLGENGAGKSTLMHMLSGLISPDAGEILVCGAPVQFDSPRAAARSGIGMVHQHFRLAGALSVEDNLALGDLVPGRFRQRRVQLRHEAEAIASQLGIAIPFSAPVASLGVAEQQRVEIVKTLLRRPRILILDEPTAVLPPDAREGLFGLVRALTAGGTSVLLISHRLEDVTSCCNRVLVLRGGRAVGMLPVEGASHLDFVRLMFGSDSAVSTSNDGESRACRKSSDRPLLTVEELSVAGRPGVRSISFRLHAGEILGLCGVDGNGQSELIKCLAGMVPPIGGRLTYDFGGEQQLGPLPADRLRRLGLAHIPEDRLHDGVVAQGSLTVNWRLTTLDHASGRSRANARNALREAISSLHIKARGLEDPISSLSGGNQQKLVLARELSTSPSIILAAHPARGVDLRTAAAITERLREARGRGAGIILLSGDLDELWSVADRVMVMADGLLRGPVDVAESSPVDVGHWMTAA